MLTHLDQQETDARLTAWNRSEHELRKPNSVEIDLRFLIAFTLGTANE